MALLTAVLKQNSSTKFYFLHSEDGPVFNFGGSQHEKTKFKMNNAQKSAFGPLLVKICMIVGVLYIHTFVFVS